MELFSSVHIDIEQVTPDLLIYLHVKIFLHVKIYGFSQWQKSL